MKNVISMLAALAWLCQPVLAAPAPGLFVKKANFANVKKGQTIPVGQKVKTQGFTVSGGSTSFGGTASLSFLPWGVAQIDMLPNSSVVLTSYGQCFGGGRVSQFDVSNEVYFTTRPKTHACTETIVCMEFSRGCVSLNSSIKVMPIGGNYLIAVSEGHVAGKVRYSSETLVTINEGQYSIVSPDGMFTKPLTIENSPVTVVSRTKTVQTLSVPEGYLLQVGNRTDTQIQFPIGLPYFILTPLSPNNHGTNQQNN
jgi:hypothetical protein